MTFPHPKLSPVLFEVCEDDWPRYHKLCAHIRKQEDVTTAVFKGKDDPKKVKSIITAQASTCFKAPAKNARAKAKAYDANSSTGKGKGKGKNQDTAKGKAKGKGKAPKLAGTQFAMAKVLDKDLLIFEGGHDPAWRITNDQTLG